MSCTAEMTIEQYLRGRVYYDIPDETLRSILLDREISEGTLVMDLSDDADERKKLRDLCLADVYMYCASLPSTRNNSSEADGQWKSEEGGYQRSAYDSRQLRAMANDIYEKYGETVQGQKIKLVSIGMRKWL